MLDLVIRNGLIVDGSGLPARRGDVALQGGRIVAVGGTAGEARTVLDAAGRVLGIFPDPGFPEGEPFDLGPGDSILLYTDGATEARSAEDENDLFGERRLRTVVAEHGADAPRAYLDAIVAALLAHTDQDEMGDDLTLVAVRRTP